jgi:hypothetical protein
MTNWDRAMRENDRFWTREASKAYEERREGVRRALRDSGGISAPWMQFQISSADYEAELRSFCCCRGRA